MASEIHILIVEHEDGLRTFIREVLEGAGGHLVEEASDAETAIESLGKNPIDLVIADIFLPGTNGIELLKQVKERWTPVQVIMIARGAPVFTR